MALIYLLLDCLPTLGMVGYEGMYGFLDIATWVTMVLWFLVVLPYERGHRLRLK